MERQLLSWETADPVTRPGYEGVRAMRIRRDDNVEASALFLSARATTDDLAVPYAQHLIVMEGEGWISDGKDKFAIYAGESLLLPRDRFHRIWTGDHSMTVLRIASGQAHGAEWVRVPDRAALARNAAERFIQHGALAISARGFYAVALSGGSTPREVYALLASPTYASRIDWKHVYIFWGDERAVPPNDPASNFRMANEALLSRVPIPPGNVHRIAAEKGASQAAAEYAETLRGLSRPGQDSVPCFDLILLGLGENGHTASLFPHSPLLRETRRWVAGEYVDEVHMERITFTFPLINAARNIFFLVAGAEKAATVRAVLRGASQPDMLPAQSVQPDTGQVVWLLDSAAAADL